MQAGTSQKGVLRIAWIVYDELQPDDNGVLKVARITQSARHFIERAILVRSNSSKFAGGDALAQSRADFVPVFRQFF